jgi:beta-galactosidase GanA
MNIQRLAALFPLGSHLCREPMPDMAELKADMEILRRNGFNLVKLQEHWAWDEAVEGRCDFGKYEELIEHAGRLDMGVYLGLTCEQAPAWLWQKHPGCRMVLRDGRPMAYQAQWTLPADGKPGPCYDDPGAMADQLRFIGELVRTLGRFQNLVVWNTWQEIGYWSGMLTGQDVCFCPNTLAKFSGWLRSRYGDIDALNRQWRTRYPDWNAVQPTRGSHLKSPLAVDIHWQYFMDNVQIADVLRARAAAIRAADPLHRPIFAHKAFPAIGGGQDWSYAACQDFLGSSSYPASAHNPWDDLAAERRMPEHQVLIGEAWNGLAMNFDAIRSANQLGAPVWAAELQGGPVVAGLHMGRIPSADDVRRWMLTAVASGVTGISFWVTRAEIAAGEINGFGLLDSEGQSTRRLEEAGRIGRALNRHADLFAAATGPAAEVAIVVDEWNAQFCGTLAQGGGHYAYSVRGWHRLLWDRGLAVDFLEAGQLDRLPRYKAVILPLPLYLAEATARKLRDWVQAGGTLICEACPGRVGEGFFCTRGEMSPTLRELFGARHHGLWLVREPGDSSRWSPPARTWGDFLEATMLSGQGLLAGHEVRANAFVQTFLADSALACLRHGERIAGLAAPAGKGRAFLLGTCVGHSGVAYVNAATAAAVGKLLHLAGVVPSPSLPLLVRRRSLPGKEAWLVTNPAADVVTRELDAAGWTSAEDLDGTPLQIADGKVRLTVDPADVRAVILTS